MASVTFVKVVPASACEVRPSVRLPTSEPAAAATMPTLPAVPAVIAVGLVNVRPVPVATMASLSW